jgi:cardiolipin synthase A/B
MNRTSIKLFLISLCIFLLCFTVAGCDISISSGGSTSNQCQSNCASGSGVQGVRVYVEPDDGESVITSAIRGASKSVWLEMYILSDRNVIRALEEAANNGLDVRVMLEPHPVGSGSVSRTLDELKAAGVKAQYTSPAFALTHEKGMVIDGSTAYIMTSNFSRDALGGSGSSSSNGTTNREYGIIDSNPQDVQAVIDIFNADWNRTPAQFSDANLVVSPVNSRSAFMNLIGSAQHTLLIEAEEMEDSAIEQALVQAASRGVQIEIILPSPSGSSGDSNRQGIDAIKGSNVTVREDPKLYMHAKIMVVDGAKAFVGSENISSQSLDQNRELGILVSDAAVLSKLQSTFQTDWGVSQGV